MNLNLPRSSQSAQTLFPCVLRSNLSAGLSWVGFSESKLEAFRLLEMLFCTALTHLSRSAAVSAWNNYDHQRNMCTNITWIPFSFERKQFQRLVLLCHLYRPLLSYVE